MFFYMTLITRTVQAILVSMSFLISDIRDVRFTIHGKKNLLLKLRRDLRYAVKYFIMFGYFAKIKLTSFKIFLVNIYIYFFKDVIS